MILTLSSSFSLALSLCLLILIALPKLPNLFIFLNFCHTMASSQHIHDAYSLLQNTVLSNPPPKTAKNDDKHGRVVNIFGIPPTASPEDISDFLEAAVGAGTISGCRLFTRRNSETLTGSGIVEFLTEEAATMSSELSRYGNLYFRGSKLIIKPKEKKGRSKVATPTLRMELHMGCLISHDVLHELWATNNVKIDVDRHSKRLKILINENSEDYMLEWRFRDIYGITSRRLEGPQGDIALLIKVWVAPQVFKQIPVQCHGKTSGFFSKNIDLIWVRTGDFSPEHSLGQSFIYCIEIPEKHRKLLNAWISGLSEFEVHFFPQKGKPLSIRKGSSYSLPQMIAPILCSPFISKLPFELIFLVNSLVQSGYLSGPLLGKNFFELLLPSSKMSLRQIIHILCKLKNKQETCYDPERWFISEAHNFKKRLHMKQLNRNLWDDGHVSIHRAYVTPCRVYFDGPDIDVSNRVTRHFSDCIDNFLRVSFVEEDFDRISSTALMVHKGRSLQGSSSQINYTKVYEHIISVLNNGITISDKTFEFLAYSSSQLRENSVWMFSSNGIISSETIRNWMGDFLMIKNVAKCAARMGQSFSSSTRSFDVYSNEVETISDIWDLTSTYCFSDGIGKISESFATEVAKKCSLGKLYGRVPSLYQIRYGGYKGVVAVDPNNRYKLSLRPSMDKFPSTQISLDILDWSRSRPSYLNRQIIILLSTLGVPDAIFEGLQTKMTQQLNQMLESGEVAQEVLLMLLGGESHMLMVEMLSAGYGPSSEPFLMRMLYAFRAVQLMHLRKRSRIFVSKGRILMGCLDETATLNYGEVFVSVSPRPRTSHEMFSDGLSTIAVHGVNRTAQNVCIVEGKVIVTKNPCVHPGDIRVLRAVNVPVLHHMVDCIVFPQRGRRPHPNECSGSDLDGDLYFVSWDEGLIPPEVDLPMEYQTPQQMIQDHPVTIQEIVEYFANYMVNDSLGLISNAHTVFADREPAKARDQKCLKLAKLFCIAVDFPKTGVAAILPPELRPTNYPDFMEKGDKPMYKSESILGKMHRSVIEENEDKRASLFTKEEAIRCYDKELQVTGFQHYLEEAQALKNLYDDKLLNLMNKYDVESEAEIFTGNILSLSRLYQRKPGEIKERIQRSVNSLKREARSWLKDYQNPTIDDQYDAELHSGDELAKASAWYHVTYHPDYVVQANGDDISEHGYLLSFPWVVHDKLLAIKKNKQAL